MKLVIIGASGHGKVIADIAKKNGYSDIVFLDDNKSVTSCNGYKVVGTSNDCFKYRDSVFFVAIGNSKIREMVFEKLLSQNLHIITLIHPKATIAEDAVIGKGTVVMAGAVINSNVHIGDGCIINTSSSVDHDCKVEDFSHISVGSHVAGTVQIGKSTWVGAGATVSNNVNITETCMIGAGAVVVRDITEAGTYVGVPAKRMK